MLLRDELEEECERIVRKNRRVAALLNVHRKVIEELLGALISIQGGDATRNSGSLVDAEA